MLMAQTDTQMYPGRLYVRSVRPAMTAPATISRMDTCQTQPPLELEQRRIRPASTAPAEVHQAYFLHLTAPHQALLSVEAEVHQAAPPVP